MPHDVAPIARPRTQEAGEVLARAFDADPLYAYILADAQERRRGLQEMFVALVKYTLLYGVCHATPDIDGAACWLRPGKTRVTLWRMVRSGMGLWTAISRFSPEARQRFMGVMGYADDVHKRLMERPHWYLWALGVEPARQGQGIGSALLPPVLARADADGLPCYLETQTEPNVCFYERRGFRVLEAGDVPGHGVPFWAMMRDPQ